MKNIRYDFEKLRSDLRKLNKRFIILNLNFRYFTKKKLIKILKQPHSKKKKNKNSKYQNDNSDIKIFCFL